MQSNPGSGSERNQAYATRVAQPVCACTLRRISIISRSRVWVFGARSRAARENASWPRPRVLAISVLVVRKAPAISAGENT